MLPPELVRIVSLAYPGGAGGREGEIILKLMGERLDGPLSDHVIDYVPVRSVSRDNERMALVAVCRRDDVIAYLEMLRSAGLHVGTLEIGPLAIRRLIDATGHGDTNANTLVINTATNSSYLTMLSGQRLLSDQKVQFGEASLLKTIARALDVSPVEAAAVASNAVAQASDDGAETAHTLKLILKPEMLRLVREIDRAFIFAASESQGAGLQQIFLQGSISDWPLALELLRECTRIPVNSLGTALKPFWDGTRHEGDFAGIAASETVIATGLALKGLTDDA